MVDVAALWIVGVTLLAQAPAAAPAPEAETAPPAAPALAPALGTPAPAAPKQESTPQPRLWVTPVAIYGLPATLADTLNQAVVNEAGQAGNHQVLSEETLGQLLNIEQRKQALGCTDPSCMTDLGKVVNADRVLSCSFSGVGEDAQVACRLLGVREGAILASKDRKCPPQPVAMADTARALVDLVLLGQVKDRRGTVALRVSAPGATVYVDGRAVGESPVAEPLKIDEGKREIVVKKGGYASWRTTVDVQAGSFTTLDVQLSATRSIQLWPLALASWAGTFLAVGPGMWAGLAAGGVADCYYWGRINPYDIPSKLPGDPLSRTSGACHALPVSTPAYKEYPHTNYDVENRRNQVIASAIVANGIFGASAVVAALTLTAGAALLVTDLIIKVVRREE